jgi:putative toxin-antitoxin system antitoxin component (TIGR02293 family)
MYNPQQIKAPKPKVIPRQTALSFMEWRSVVDHRVLRLFNSKSLKRNLRDQAKVNLAVLWSLTVKALMEDRQTSAPVEAPMQQLDIHQSIVEGLPGEALLISSAMAFDSMQEALPFFEVSAKTARGRVGDVLPASQGEMALRIGRVLTFAWDLFGSLEIARQYLRTPNFALGGAIPRDLLRTSEGEQVILAELQTQAAGGPV